MTDATRSTKVSQSEDTPLADTNLLNIIFYDESWWAFRLCLVLGVILGWGIFGARLFENLDSLQAILWQCFRYMLAPMAAMVGALMLGASYVQDVYELERYRLGLRYMWSAMFNSTSTGLISGVLAGSLGFVFFGMVSVLIFQQMYDVSISIVIGFGFGMSALLILTILFGANMLPALTITDGKKKIEEDEINLLERIGGPGVLYVEPGNVVVMERLESPSNVLGAGMHFINRYQRIKDIISLKDQQVGPKNLMATTKDGIPVNIKDFQFRYRLYAGHRNHGVVKRTLNSPYPFSVQAARNRTYNRSVNAMGTLVPWDNAVQFSFDGAISGYINKNLLDTVLFPQLSDKDPRREILKAINSPGNRAALKNNGAELLWCDLGRFEAVPAEINTERMKAWFAQWAGNGYVLRAQGEAEAIATLERSSAEGQATILRGMMQALDDAHLSEKVDENMWNIVLAYTARIIESMTDAQGDLKDKAATAPKG